MNNGKRFENNFKNSVPDNIFYYRFRYGTSSWDKGQATRFQAKNICDCMLYDGKYLYFLELKTHKGKSIPLSAIRENQVKSLLDAYNYQGIISGLVVNFSDTEETFFMDIDLVNEWYYNTIRKSIPIAEFREKCIQIDSHKKKVNYSYDVDKFIKNISKMDVMANQN